MTYLGQTLLQECKQNWQMIILYIHAWSVFIKDYK